MLTQAVSGNLTLTGMGLQALFPWLSVEDAALNDSGRSFLFKRSPSSFPSPWLSLCLQSEEVFCLWEMI